MRNPDSKLVEITEEIHRKLKKLSFETDIAMKRLSTAIITEALEDENFITKVLKKLINK